MYKIRFEQEFQVVIPKTLSPSIGLQVSPSLAPSKSIEVPFGGIIRTETPSSIVYKAQRGSFCRVKLLSTNSQLVPVGQSVVGGQMSLASMLTAVVVLIDMGGVVRAIPCGDHAELIEDDSIEGKERV